MSAVVVGDDRLRLQVDGLRVELPTGRRLLDGVSLSVREGEVVVVLGPSGAGKSTLGDVLFDLLPDRAPEMRVDARALRADPARMALVLQQGSLFDHLDVAGNLRFAARRRRGVRLSDEAVAALLAEVGLVPTQQAVSALSGGEERRVNVARALATKPDLIFFDEPSSGLDVVNVRRIGALVRRVCSEHRTAAIVVTHDPLLAALTGDRLLFLDRHDGSVTPLLDAWSGPADAADEAGLDERREAIELALLARLEEGDPSETATTPPGWGERTRRRLRGAAHRLGGPGRLVREVLTVLWALPGALRHPADLAQLGWRALYLTGYSGLPFFALVAAIFSATFLSIAFAAAELVSPGVILDNLQGDFILALTPPLCGFLFAARSGSALTAWLGGLSLRRQTDALKSLGVSVDEYLRVPAFFGTFLGFVLSSLVFGALMYLSATVTAVGFGVADAGEVLRRTSPSFERQLVEKTLLYGVLLGAIGTHMGLLTKRTSRDVAQGITRSIIFSTVAVVLSELFFAIDLHGG